MYIECAMCSKKIGQTKTTRRPQPQATTTSRRRNRRRNRRMSLSLHSAICATDGGFFVQTSLRDLVIARYKESG